MDLHAGDHVRVYFELGSHFQFGKGVTRIPTDVNEADVQQGFLNLVFPFETGNKLTLRVGRQQMTFGSGRLVSIREGPNIRRSFDGARFTIEAAKATLDAFVVRTVRLQVGAFNDEPEEDEAFWGIYGVAPMPRLPDGHLDVYYLGFARKGAAFQQGIGDERRHSFGTRVWGNPGAWDYNCETLIQTGSLGAADILAWTLATDTGYTFKSLLFSPRLGLKADIASGDPDPTDDRLGTFNALFPKQPYFGEASLLAPANLIDLHPTVSLQLSDRLRVTTDVDFFWKHQLKDAIYAPPGRPLVRGGSNTSRYIGAQVNAELECELTKHLSVTVSYSHFFAGPAVTSSDGRDVDFTAASVKFAF
jgi:hypothetical protein